MVKLYKLISGSVRTFAHNPFFVSTKFRLYLIKVLFLVIIILFLMILWRQNQALTPAANVNVKPNPTIAEGPQQTPSIPGIRYAAVKPDSVKCGIHAKIIRMIS